MGHFFNIDDKLKEVHRGIGITAVTALGFQVGLLLPLDTCLVIQSLSSSGTFWEWEILSGLQDSGQIAMARELVH